MGKPTVAGARALKTHLGAYLRKVRHGATVVVTDRGQPIAELRPLEQDPGSTHPGLARLLASGAVTRGNHAPLKSFRAIRSNGASLAAAVLEDREDRF